MFAACRGWDGIYAARARRAPREALGEASVRKGGGGRFYAARRRFPSRSNGWGRSFLRVAWRFFLKIGKGPYPVSILFVAWRTEGRGEQAVSARCLDIRKYVFSEKYLYSENILIESYIFLFMNVFSGGFPSNILEYQL